VPAWSAHGLENATTRPRIDVSSRPVPRQSPPASYWPGTYLAADLSFTSRDGMATSAAGSGLDLRETDSKLHGADRGRRSRGGLPVVDARPVSPGMYR